MKHRKKPIPKTEYARRARLLRKFGFTPAYRINKSNTNAAKAAVTRVYNAHRFFLNPKPKTQPVKFVRATKAQIRIAREIISSEAITPGGYFLMVPRGVKKSEYSLNIRPRRKGVKAVIEERIRGKQFDVVLRPNWREMLSDSRGAIARIVKEQRKEAPKGKRLRGVKIVVGGMESKGPMVSPAALSNYFDDLFDAFVGNEEQFDSPREYHKRAREFADKFQLRFIYR